MREATANLAIPFAIPLCRLRNIHLTCAPIATHAQFADLKAPSSALPCPPLNNYQHSACLASSLFPPSGSCVDPRRKNEFTMAMEESWPSMIWSSVRSWFTPTVLFLLINLVIGTIVLTSSSRRRSHRRPHEDETAVAPHELPPLVRGPSAALERLRSLGLHRFRSGEFPFDAVAPIPESALPQPLARGPSALLDRLRSIGLNRFRSGEIPFDALPIPESDPPPAQTTDCITVCEDDDNVPDRKSRHYERIRSDSAGKEEAAGIKLAERMKKSASASSAFGRFEEAEIVRRPAASKSGRGSAVAEEEVEVDARADDFINRFRQQLQLQRLDSIMRYKDMLNRSK
ncbi:pathogen-associated molecular patterns-induced protein A70-like [Zingiber officinale]|uniref:pathogen-associated molecular patterns-induced protein A70-like n=1 Tax=Zingiber officinale TaxID=94328 RepID=UPI001C4DB82A|nr:pathogen-associated molecular patterns-induced protein A70-like [Zingiber officinale]